MCVIKPTNMKSFIVWSGIRFYKSQNPKSNTSWNNCLAVTKFKVYNLKYLKAKPIVKLKKIEIRVCAKLSTQNILIVPDCASQSNLAEFQNNVRYSEDVTWYMNRLQNNIRRQCS